MTRCQVILGLLLFIMSTPTSAQLWATAVSRNENQGTAIVFRYIQEFPKDYSRAQQPDRIILMWRYQGDKGMPSVDERAQMDELEDALAPLQEKGFSTLALVSTGNDLKEWTYYARSADSFLRRLNLALHSKPEFPIEIHASPDPSWATYERFIAGVKK